MALTLTLSPHQSFLIGPKDSGPFSPVQKLQPLLGAP